MSKNVVIVGGHGKISLLLAKLIGPHNSVKSVIRTKDHEADVKAASAHPLFLNLEESPVSEFTKAFEGVDVVYFSAGAGGKGGPDASKRVDYEGAVKVFDAIESVEGKKPRLVLVSAIDVRDTDGEVPSHYDEADKDISKRTWGAIGIYMKWKYEADKNLIKRSKFDWTIVRPGGLSDEDGKGTASIGVTHIVNKISRQDVAQTLALLLDREDAAGLALDVVGGETPISQALDVAIEKKESAFSG
ncbi:NAD(P)-binding protein [Athelia psychrophila]|uniref:NAD(P)-binding protein n=1 Tax=Athelia psychrophila TaxID=1759441 RepID=A0A166VY28_9AGAM|nr:NAD(P)-binding protein [Fibularhizoctonia sp. CBS 109695]